MFTREFIRKISGGFGSSLALIDFFNDHSKESYQQIMLKLAQKCDVKVEYEEDTEVERAYDNSKPCEKEEGELKTYYIETNEDIHKLKGDDIEFDLNWIRIMQHGYCVACVKNWVYWKEADKENDDE